jgi:hypothetical protein
MTLAKSLGCNTLIINSDCFEEIEVMKSGGDTYGLASAIYKYCIAFGENLKIEMKKHTHLLRGILYASQRIKEVWA